MDERASYADQLRDEAALWGSEAERMAGLVPPDWRAHRQLRYNIITHNDDIEALLAEIQPDMQTLELGCASGWLTLAMAQRGAHASGFDISERSLNIARSYYENVREETVGDVHYEVADLNTLTLPESAYDIIVIKGTLHHLTQPKRLIQQIEAALKPGGLLWISDEARPVHSRTALVSAAFMFLLPTEVRYRDKIGGLLKFGLKAPSRIRASMEAEGLSPFEGAGREEDWLTLVEQHLQIEQHIDKAAFTGYLAHQLRMHDRIAIPLLKILRGLDNLLVRLGLLQNSGVVIWARKRSSV